MILTTFTGRVGHKRRNGVTYERQIVLSSYKVAESTNRSEVSRFLFFLFILFAFRRSVAFQIWCAKIQFFDWTRVARSSLWHSVSVDQLQCKGKSNGELLAYVSFRDRWQRRVICYLTYLSAGFVRNSLQRDYAIYMKNQVERVTNYLLISPSKLLSSFTSVIVVRLHDADRQTNQEWHSFCFFFFFFFQQQRS